MSKYDYEYESDETYCYPGTDVLRNKYNIKNKTELDAVERGVTSLRYYQYEKSPSITVFDFESLKKMHKNIFGDIYGWAGCVRTVDTSKGVLFCKSEFIEENAKILFDKLSKEKFLDMDRNRLVERLSYYLSEINAIHPFREGNGRAQRAFINQIALSAGYYLDFSKVGKEEMISASFLSFHGDYSKMTDIISKIIGKNS